MAPKGKGGDKGGKSKDAGAEKGGGKAKGAQSINVRHILCEKHSKKEQAVEKLNNGTKFDEVAREFSEDKARQGKTIPISRFSSVFESSISNLICSPIYANEWRAGGSLGWKTKGSLMPEFEAVAFELEASTTGNPKWTECKTSEGYHIIMVEGRK